MGQTLDAFQSVFGMQYGEGHDSPYVNQTKGTYIEAVAQIVSDITGLRLLDDAFPNAVAKIESLIKGEERYTKKTIL